MGYDSEHQALATRDLDDEETSRTAFSTKSSFNSARMKEKQTLKVQKLPSYGSEVLFVIVNMFLLKFYSDRFFDAMTFFLLSTPMLLYLVVSLFVNLLEFIKLLHIEELSGSLTAEEAQGLVTPKQSKLIVRIFRDMCFYFGVYYLSSQMDQVFQVKDDALEKLRSEP